MNIKSLLLGSAAALVAVSGARAADAVVVAEPEPMDYVRVCDMYGAGFYYIPGTETCLAIGGYARYQIDFDDDDSGWRKMARAELIFAAKSETELGTLSSLIDLRGNVYSGHISGEDAPLFDDDQIFIQQVWIDLAGVRIGMSDTLYDADIAGEFDSGGGDRVHFVRFQKTFGAVTVGAALEEADYDWDYVPNAVGMASATFGMATVSAYAAYDATAEEFSVKGIANIKPNDVFGVDLIATYESGGNFYGVGYEWSVGGSVYAKIGEKAKVTFGGQYFIDAHGSGGADDYAVGVVLDYTIVENLAAKLAVNYENGDSYSDGSVGGFFRLARSFGHQG